MPQCMQAERGFTIERPSGSARRDDVQEAPDREAGSENDGGERSVHARVSAASRAP